MPSIYELPSPLEILFNPISLLATGIYGLFILWELLFPARPLPRVKFWALRGLLAFVMYFFLSSYLPLFWDGALSAYRLFDISTWHWLAQAAAGIFAYQFVAYWYHRAMHSSTLLWRVFHQMHHSAERLDTFGAFWLSPYDIAGFTLMSSLSMVFVVGLSAEATTIAMLFLFFCVVFQHTNVKTPTWLGYFIQRPESHSYHHGQGLHKHNYADLPIVDMVFGTFRNPKRFYDTGFYLGASNRLFEMLTFRLVDREPDRFDSLSSSTSN